MQKEFTIVGTSHIWVVIRLKLFFFQSEISRLDQCFLNRVLGNYMFSLRRTNELFSKIHFRRLYDENHADNNIHLSLNAKFLPRSTISWLSIYCAKFSRPKSSDCSPTSTVSLGFQCWWSPDFYSQFYLQLPIMMTFQQANSNIMPSKLTNSGCQGRVRVGRAGAVRNINFATGLQYFGWQQQPIRACEYLMPDRSWRTQSGYAGNEK